MAATARHASGLRREFRAWLGIDVTGELFEDVVLVVYEAVANIAEHAYGHHPGHPGRCGSPRTAPTTRSRLPSPMTAAGAPRPGTRTAAAAYP